MKSRGVTLIELLIAVVLTGIATMITLGMLSQESSHFQRTREKVKMQATARDAMRILDEEIRNAGYNTYITSASRVHAVPLHCPEVAYSSAGESIKTGLYHTTIDSGDGLSYRFYELPASGVLTACGIGAGSLFREISYRLRNGRLERQYRTDTTTNTNWIPFAENVVSFKVRYGLLSNPVDTPAGFGDANFSDPANWNTHNLSLGGTAGNMVISNFAGNQTAWISYSLGFPGYTSGSIYRVSFDGTPNAAMIDPADGPDSTYIGMVMAYTSPSFTIQKGPFYYRPSNLANTSFHHEVYIYANGNTSSYHPAFMFRLNPGQNPWAGQQFTIANLKIRKVSSTAYKWVSNPTSTQMAQVGAIRIVLLVKTSQNSQEPSAATYTGAQLGDTAISTYTASGSDSAKAHILYDRVIPVVNNALQNQQ